jgi:hypothetical protein
LLAVNNDLAHGAFPGFADRVPDQQRVRRETRKWSQKMAFVLWILAVILVVAGIFALFRKQILWGIVLIVVGLLVGPGGVSVFT